MYATNPKIADVFFKSGLTEAWGRGIANIFDECEKYGLPTPEFKIGHKIVTLVIRFKNSITPHRKGDEPVNDVLKDILEFIKSNPGIKKTSIITHVGKSKATPIGDYVNCTPKVRHKTFGVHFTYTLRRVEKKDEF